MDHKRLSHCRALPRKRRRLRLFPQWLRQRPSQCKRPRSREKLRHMYDLLVHKVSGKDFIEVLFGEDLDKATRDAIERRLAIMGAVLSAAILESHFRPKLLPKQHLQVVLEELYEALIHV